MHFSRQYFSLNSCAKEWIQICFLYINKAFESRLRLYYLQDLQSKRILKYSPLPLLSKDSDESQAFTRGEISCLFTTSSVSFQDDNYDCQNGNQNEKANNGCDQKCLAICLRALKFCYVPRRLEVEGHDLTISQLSHCHSQLSGFGVGADSL